MKRVVDSPKYSIDCIEHDILKVHIKPNVNLEAKDMKELGRHYDNLIKDKKVPFLVILDDYVLMTEGARRIISNPKRLKHKLMEAMVTTTLSQKLLINNIIQKQRDQHQIDMFDSESDAMRWIIRQLASIKEQNPMNSLKASF